ncbi:MAG: dCTP deaminase [Endomicrobiales bacterium]|nr:dCTP deaminase [Endomicrobiales bacterium]
MVKPDKWIREMGARGMIEPFAPEQVKDGKVSFGVSSYGYDMRVADEFKVFEPSKGDLLDPKKYDASLFREVKAKGFIEIPPNSFVLARSVEYFRIPRNILTVCFGKSTYARCGVVVNVTPFEPEWEGYVTMSISNTSPVPVKLYCNEGIAQVIFLEASEVCGVSYADKKGKYQSQKTITHAKI